MKIERIEADKVYPIYGTDLEAGHVYEDGDGELFIADDEGGITSLADGTSYRDTSTWRFVREVTAKLVITG